MTQPAKTTWFQKLHKAVTRLSILPRALTLAYRAAAGWSAASLFLTLVHGLMPVAFIWLVRDLINQLSASPFDGLKNLDWLGIMPSLISLGLVLLVMEILQPLSRWIRAAQSEAIELHVRELVQTQANCADLAFFESPEFHDQLYRAGPQAGATANSLLDNITQILQSLVTMVALIIILIPYAWWLPLGLAASLLPAFGVIILDAWRQGNWWRESTRDERRANYLNWLITSGVNAAELRIHQLGAYLQKQHRILQQKLAAGRLSLDARHALTAVAAAVFSIAFAAGALAMLVFIPSQKTIILGDIVLIFQAFYQSQRATKSLLSQCGILINQAMQLRSFYQYLEYSPKVIAPSGQHATPASLSHAIHFDEVSFRYPGNPELSLDNLSATIPVGKITVVVGANGSGKSTLIKLLTRLYDPCSGAIYFDNINIRDLDPQQIRQQFAVLTQEPLELQDTVSNNIRSGRIDAVENLEQRIEHAAETTHADRFINTLEHGLETHLGSWFSSGTDLSSGQWRRIGLTRAIFRDAPVLVLDEPTSAMDALNEAEWVNQLPMMAANKTVIFITHRLAAARHADQILVFSKGQVSEQGSHNELIHKDGEYAALYNAQSAHFA